METHLTAKTLSMHELGHKCFIQCADLSTVGGAGNQIVIVVNRNTFTLLTENKRKSSERQRILNLCYVM